MFVAVDGRAAGLVGVADPIKESTAEALRLLRDEQIRVVMLTGDSRTTAQAVAAELGIDEVHAEVLPENKQQIVERLRSEGRIVAMAGDGINDAPALAAAHVGIAMGTGTDVAMEAAGVTLVQGDLRGVARAIKLSRATMTQHPPEPVLRLCLQRAGSADRGRRAVSGGGAAAQPDDRQRGDELQQRVGDRQRPAVAQSEAVVRSCMQLAGPILPAAVRDATLAALFRCLRRAVARQLATLGRLPP